MISSNDDLMVYGQGLLNLSGPGDGIKARRLFLSLFYNIEVRCSMCTAYIVFIGHATMVSAVKFSSI